MSNGFKHIVKTLAAFIILSSSLYSQDKDVKRELKRLNAKIDRVRVLVDSLELDNQILLPELRLDQLQEFHRCFDNDIYSKLAPKQVVASRVSEGGTGFSRVQEQLKYWKESFASTKE